MVHHLRAFVCQGVNPKLYKELQNEKIHMAIKATSSTRLTKRTNNRNRYISKTKKHNRTSRQLHTLHTQLKKRV